MEVRMVLLQLQEMVTILVESKLDIWYYYICYFNLILPYITCMEDQMKLFI